MHVDIVCFVINILGEGGEGFSKMNSQEGHNDLRKEV